MRLTASETQAIFEGVRTEAGPLLPPGEKIELILFGSRADDLLKGGDIDLLLKTVTTDTARKLRTRAHVILSAIKARLGDQKVDLSIKSYDEIEGDPFWKIALGKTQRLF